MTRLVIQIPSELLGDLEPLLIQRGLSVEEVIRLYLRSLVNGAKRSRAVSLSDDMPIGKFKGEKVETVIRAEPGYVSWLAGNIESFKLAPDALALVEELAQESS
jgi:hypothetical protein